MIAAGQTIGSYRILQKIGTGGMGAVYLAEHPLIGKRVALKVIHRDLANNKEVVQRFFQEAKAVTKIGSDHIVEIHDFGQTPDGDHFYIMEYLEGQTLAQLLGRERVLPVMRALHIGAQIASALLAAHASGVIHRDLKPDNVMLTHKLGDPDFVVLLDFGLAKIFSGDRSAVKTAAGVLLGTPQYMSPEACESRTTIDHRTDIYALGILLFQMMTGMLPFDGETMGEVLVKQVTQLPPPMRGFNQNIAPSVEQIVLRCLAKSPDQRFSTMQLLRDALLDPEAYLHNSPPMAPARSLAPGEMKVDAKTVMAYAAQEQAAKRAQLPLPAPPPSMGGQAQAKTLMHDGSLVPARIQPTGAMAAPPDMTAPAMPKMNTMRIDTPAGYSSRPPRKMWPIVLVLALLLGLGGGAFAVAWFGRTDKAADVASDAEPAGSSGSSMTTAGSAGSATVGSAAASATGSAAAATGSATTTAAKGSAVEVATGSGSAGSAASGSALVSQPPAVDAGVPPDATPTTPGTTQMAVIVIDSTPPGADVFGPDKTSLGKTPLKLDLPISDLPLTFELRLAGYRKKTKDVIVRGNTMVQVPLDRLPKSTQTVRPPPKRDDNALERPD